jgi:hypothetical protein
MIAEQIIKNLEEMIEKKLPMSAQYWLEAAEKLAVLMGDETDKLFALQKQVAQLKSTQIMQGNSVAQAKVVAEASDVYEQMQKQKAFVERINEIIRIAKIQARMRNDEYNNNF